MNTAFARCCYLPRVRPDAIPLGRHAAVRPARRLGRTFFDRERPRSSAAIVDTLGRAPRISRRRWRRARITYVSLSLDGCERSNQALALAQAKLLVSLVLALDRGARAMREDRRALTRLLWDTWGPLDGSTTRRVRGTAAVRRPSWADVRFTLSPSLGIRRQRSRARPLNTAPPARRSPYPLVIRAARTPAMHRRHP